MLKAAYYNDRFYMPSAPRRHLCEARECLASTALPAIACRPQRRQDPRRPAGQFHGTGRRRSPSNSAISIRRPSRSMPRFAFTDTAQLREAADRSARQHGHRARVIDSGAHATHVDGTAGGQPALPVLVGTARYLFIPAAATAAVALSDGSTRRHGRRRRRSPAPRRIT